MDINLSLGKKVKKLRKRQNMTLKELSEKTNLSVGFLSQLERGLSTVAIDSLDVIAKALGVDLTYFINPQDDKKDKIVLKSYEQATIEVVNEKFIYQQLTSDIKNKSMLPRLVEILPMEETENLMTYPHEGEEFIYVIEGILTLFVNSQKYELYPGDSAYYKSTIPHNWANYTSKKVKILSINVPNIFEKSKKNKGGL